MDDITKFIKRLTQKEREIVGSIVKKIISRNWQRLDIKKLKGHSDIYRVRKGNIRIIFFDVRSDIRILSISRRNEGTYKNY